MISSTREITKAGGLISYGSNVVDAAGMSLFGAIFFSHC